MPAIPSRIGDLPVAAPRSPRAGALKRRLRRASAVAYAALDRLALPYRDIPSEVLRFPPY